MANKTVYPYGTGGQLPSSIGIVNDRTTGGADKAWSAEQGKLACQDIDKNTEDLFSMFATDIDKSKFTENVGWTILGTNTWQYVQTAQAENYGSILVPIAPGTRYRIYAHETVQILALLASDSMVANASPDFCSGFNGRVVLQPGETYDCIAPEDAAYLYMCIRSSGNVQDGTAKYSDGDYTGAVLNLRNNDAASNAVIIDTSELPIEDEWLITSQNVWAKAVEGSQQIVLIPIVPGKKYVAYGGSEESTGVVVALLASATKSAGATPDFCEDYEGRIVLQTGDAFAFTAPEDAAYFYLTLKSNFVVKHGWLGEQKLISEAMHELDLSTLDDGRDKFNIAPEYFAWEKMEQQTKLKWTPISGDIQKASSTAKFPANTEQTGVPYSSVWEYMKFIGTDVSFHTFMTALRNKYSLMYTECVREGYSKSSYGRTYHGAANSGPFYGNVCSGLASYALGSLPYTTEKFAELATQGILEVVYDQSANGVLRGDLLWQTGHVRMIKDVWRKNGVVTKVLVCEEVQPQAKDNAIMAASEFNTFLAQNSMIIYRYKDLYKNINYTPSPYVAVGDETPVTVTYNDDICTFAGDRAAFAEGELIYIHCLNLDYPQMELYKGNTLVETITLASDSRVAKTSDNLAYVVNLSNSNLAYGMYKCRLKNGSTYSDYTYFEVVDTSVSADGAFASTKGVAVLYFFTDSTGRDPEAMDAINSLHSGTVDTSGADSEHPILRVIFQGEYGRVFAQAQVL